MEADTALCTVIDYYYCLGAQAGWNRCETGQDQLAQSRKPRILALKEAMAVLTQSEAGQSNETEA